MEGGEVKVELEIGEDVTKNLKRKLKAQKPVDKKCKGENYCEYLDIYMTLPTHPITNG